MKPSIFLLAVLVVACGGEPLSPLVEAAREGDADRVRALLAEGSDPNRREGVNDWTPLEHALHKNRNEAALALLDGGAIAWGEDGAAALRMAAGYGNSAMVAELLRRGADPREAPGGPDALMTDAVGGAWDIDYGWSGCQGHTESVRLLLAIDPALRLPDSFTARLALRKARNEGCRDLVALVGRD